MPPPLLFFLLLAEQEFPFFLRRVPEPAALPPLSFALLPLELKGLLGLGAGSGWGSLRLPAAALGPVMVPVPGRYAGAERQMLPLPQEPLIDLLLFGLGPKYVAAGRQAASVLPLEDPNPEGTLKPDGERCVICVHGAFLLTMLPCGTRTTKEEGY